MKRFFRTHWRLVCGAVVGGLFVFYLGTGYVIGRQVRDTVSSAQSVYQGNPVAALIRVVESRQSSIAEKNSAVWALGQLGSDQALTTMEALQTGETCDHTSGICQRGLAKSIELCRGATNIGSVVWRHGDLARR